MVFIMDYQEDFKNALIKYLEPLGHGAQTKLSRKRGISSNVICSIIKGRRTASERTKNKIANGLGYTYDEFLTFSRGHDIKNNIIPIRRRRDMDPKFAQAVALLEEIYDIGKKSLILDQVIVNVRINIGLSLDV